MKGIDDEVSSFHLHKAHFLFSPPFLHVALELALILFPFIREYFWSFSLRPLRGATSAEYI